MIYSLGVLSNAWIPNTLLDGKHLMDSISLNIEDIKTEKRNSLNKVAF